jgi:ribonucleoside-diphosphate reductase alpha chain
MNVIKRNGEKECVKFDKITERVQRLCWGLDMDYVDPAKVTQKVCASLVDNIKTQEIDALTVRVCADMGVYHPDYKLLAGRVSASNLQKCTQATFSEAMHRAASVPRSPMISAHTLECVRTHARELDSKIDTSRDFVYDIFAMETLRRGYLLAYEDEVFETPQYMFMRVAVGIHGDDLDMVFELYDLLSSRVFIHSTPTLFNSGTPCPQLASCFLLPIKEDSIDGIYDTLKECALISQRAGGIGLSIQNVRAQGSYINGSGGKASGIVPMLHVFEKTALYVDQARKRKGSFAIYIEPHHPDILQFLDLRKNGGSEEFRTRDLFTALWASNLFFERVFSDEEWSLFDPATAPGLEDVHGDEYARLYTKYEGEGRAVRTMRARDLWKECMNAQMETGAPYILNKDECNKKSNQQNLGTIRSSNLCAEIVEYSSPTETSVCTLGQINLSQFVHAGAFDYARLAHTAERAIYHLNKVIDVCAYPTECARASNMRHRPLGLGVSGLHDVFFKLGHAFDSEEARTLNARIFETIYRGAMRASCDLARAHGPYETFAGSPASEGRAQFHMWGLSTSDLYWDDWCTLLEDVRTYGLRNSLLTALMPTASSATILGVTECFEPQTSNIFSRKVLSGEYSLINTYLVRDLCAQGLWNEQMMKRILSNDGSVQGIEDIPTEIKRKYRTAWEYKMRPIIQMSADRAPFVDQSQSLNLYMSAPTIPKLTSMYKFAWSCGLKTMCYYLRTRAATEAMKFTVGCDDETGCTMCHA